MPATDREHGEVVRRIEPPGEPLREQQQHGAGDAAEEVRRLDDAERQHAIEQREACRGRRRRTGEQQHQPGEEREHGQHARRELLGHRRPSVRRATRAGLARGAVAVRRRPATSSATASGIR